MVDRIPQPDAAPLAEPLVASLAEVVSSEANPPVAVDHSGEHSNDVSEIRFRDGRRLMVKRGRYAWVAERFQASRLASELLRQRAGILAPAPLDLPDDLHSEPLEAYWRVDLPTLDELWPRLGPAARTEVLRSWGRLIRAVHRIGVGGPGPLVSCERGAGDLPGFLARDLAERLLPAAWGEWPEGARVGEALLPWISEVERREAGRVGVLVHGDLHMGNVLCRMDADGPRCVGLLDLETAFSGPPEMDWAKLEVLHGPLFQQPLEARWIERVWEGYGRRLDPLLLGFLRAYHLLNLGFYDACLGFSEHVANVAAAARREVASLEFLRTLPPPRRHDSGRTPAADPEPEPEPSRLDDGPELCPVPGPG